MEKLREVVGDRNRKACNDESCDAVGVLEGRPKGDPMPTGWRTVADGVALSVMSLSNDTSLITSSSDLRRVSRRMLWLAMVAESDKVFQEDKFEDVQFCWRNAVYENNTRQTTNNQLATPRSKKAGAIWSAATSENCSKCCP